MPRCKSTGPLVFSRAQWTDTTGHTICKLTALANARDKRIALNLITFGKNTKVH